MKSDNIFTEIDEEKKKAEEINKALKKEKHFLEDIEENIKEDADKDEIKNIRNNLN
ncbi:hypothetical protein HON58_04035 [Candidatus Peregrinibacteria bacterium]|jgi:hypothetical protein|nr:hypothetical protein [Candidatus Peregrinibacteria bacterium]